MIKYFSGLLVVNVELTSRCNKKCFMCGRRKIEKEYPKLVNWGDMDFGLVKSIAEQLPEGIVVQLHNNGEPLLYPNLNGALQEFRKQIRCFDTNGKLLLEKADDIIRNMETLTISVIENDPEGDEQYNIVKKFLEIKGNRKPLMIYRLLGKVGMVYDEEFDKWNPTYIRHRWYRLSGIVATRILHSEYGSFNYSKKVTIPEHGICLDLLSHLVIDRFGDVYPCVRFNPYKYNNLGTAKQTNLIDIWNNEKRLKLIQEHIKGNRNCSKLCSKCEYWGIPRGD